MVLIFDKMFNDPNMKFSLEVPTILKKWKNILRKYKMYLMLKFLLSKMSVELADVVNAKDAEENKRISIFI